MVGGRAILGIGILGLELKVLMPIVVWYIGHLDLEVKPESQNEEVLGCKYIMREGRS